MFQLKGKIREKLNLGINKLVLLRAVDNEGNYALVASRYFSKKDSVIKIKRNAYDVHLKNQGYERGSSKIYFMDYDLKAPIVFGSKIPEVYTAKEFGKLLVIEQVQGLADRIKSGNADLIKNLMFLGVGVVVGVLVGQYIPIGSG